MDSYKNKTRHEVRCYRPNIDGTLTLVKTINPEFREIGYSTHNQFVCKFPINGDYDNGPFCDEVFYSTSKNAVYCPECRKLQRKLTTEQSKKRQKENNKKPKNSEINRNPRLPVNKI